MRFKSALITFGLLLSSPRSLHVCVTARHEVGPFHVKHPISTQRSCSLHIAERLNMVAEEMTCRLCWGDEDDGPLVQPCACRGSAKFIHQHCLEQWRRTSPRVDAAYRCGQCLDEYRDALSIELLSARLQMKRADGQSALFTLDTLAMELQVQGKYDKAGPLYREALGVRRETLGNRHLETLGTMSNLASLLYAKGDLAAAELLYRETLEVERETLANRHPSTLTSINSLSLVLADKGDLTAAEPLCREALKGRRETLGNRHPSTLTSINNLGMLLKAKGDLVAAGLLCREALKGRRETLGNRHPHTLTSINNLGVLLEARGDLPAAGLLLREALEVRRETLGDQHPHTLTSINNLGRLHGKHRPRWMCGVRRYAVGIWERWYTMYSM